ncbi:hypothetical protein GCM10010517_43140 [Streptosporangium fragile]|uniref:Cell division protein FtsL n=1 Tax=Streptosporangium fragile TaxID=46186 RepID=A0ABN3W1Y0_9ACTN
MRVPRAVPRRRGSGPARPEPVADQAPPARAVPRPRRARAPRTPFVLLVVGLLCGGLVSLLLLNTVLAQDSFLANELRNDTKRLRQEKQEKKNRNAQLEMPGVLAGNAEKQGQQPDWERARVIVPDGSASRAASGGQKLVGREQTEGTGR